MSGFQKTMAFLAALVLLIAGATLSFVAIDHERTGSLQEQVSKTQDQIDVLAQDQDDLADQVGAIAQQTRQTPLTEDDVRIIMGQEEKVEPYPDQEYDDLIASLMLLGMMLGDSPYPDYPYPPPMYDEYWDCDLRPCLVDDYMSDDGWCVDEWGDPYPSTECWHEGVIVPDDHDYTYDYDYYDPTLDIADLSWWFDFEINCPDLMNWISEDPYGEESSGSAFVTYICVDEFGPIASASFWESGCQEISDFEEFGHFSGFNVELIEGDVELNDWGHPALVGVCGNLGVKIWPDL